MLLCLYVHTNHIVLLWSGALAPWAKMSSLNSLFSWKHPTLFCIKYKWFWCVGVRLLMCLENIYPHSCHIFEVSYNLGSKILFFLKDYYIYATAMPIAQPWQSKCLQNWKIKQQEQAGAVLCHAQYLIVGIA